jgi:membrane protein implicated in regulation of membrane protease activity
MNTPRRTPPSADVATEVNGLLAGLGIITAALFPIALPGLLLFVVAPLALVAVVGVLLAIPLVLPVWLVRTLIRSRSRRRRPRAANGSTDTVPALC